MSKKCEKVWKSAKDVTNLKNRFMLNLLFRDLYLHLEKGATISLYFVEILRIILSVFLRSNFKIVLNVVSQSNLINDQWNKRCEIIFLIENIALEKLGLILLCLPEDGKYS